MATKQAWTRPPTHRYSPAEPEQAVRLVRRLRKELGTDHGTVGRLATQLGYGVESLPGRGQVQEQPVVAFGAEWLQGVPGPSQVTLQLSPVSHTTLEGVAVALAVTGPAVADAVSLPGARGDLQPRPHAHQLRGAIRRGHLDRRRRAALAHLQVP